MTTPFGDDPQPRADFAYLAAWRMPSKETACRLETAVTEYGFHTYFEQVNARGEIVPPDAELGHMLRTQ